jgi:hypothetical protein
VPEPAARPPVSLRTRDAHVPRGTPTGRARRLRWDHRASLPHGRAAQHTAERTAVSRYHRTAVRLHVTRAVAARCSPMLRRRPGQRKGVSRPVGRVLCTRRSGPAVIHLGLPLPAASVRSTREHRAGRPPALAQATRIAARGPLDLAPGGVYQAAAVTRDAGGLLHHRFTLTPPPRRRGGLLSVALSRGSPRVGVTDHPALWSPDLPHRAEAQARPPGRLTRPKDTPSRTCLRTP